jgi:cellulose synthase/poly-beta-1,6-N-acetylglucosamine synthase-like glycosyltransferase
MIVLTIYTILVLLATLIWIYIPSVTRKRSSTPLVTAIVVVRNEEKNIEALLHSFKKQSYPNLEVLLIDDASTDQTRALAQARQWPGLRILSLQRQGQAPKKAGITLGIKEAQGDLIFCTDGDCSFPPDLIQTYVAQMENPSLQFLAGPVTFKSAKGIWPALQTVEFASLLGTAGVALARHTPLMCSAANLFFRKSAFETVNGYEGNQHLASGDDEFLMNKIHRSFPKGIGFNKDRRCIVETEASPSWPHFYHQRKRWAGKWNKSDHRFSQLTAAFVFLVNLLTIYYAFTGQWTAVLVRLVAEFLFLSAVLVFMGKAKNIAMIPLTQCLYSFYVVFFGLNSLIPGKYNWKDRRLK